MELNAKTNFTITLDSGEMRLIIAALHCGLKEDQRTPALELQKRLVKARASALVHLAQEAQKYADNLGES